MGCLGWRMGRGVGDVSRGGAAPRRGPPPPGGGGGCIDVEVFGTDGIFGSWRSCRDLTSVEDS